MMETAADDELVDAPEPPPRPLSGRRAASLAVAMVAAATTVAACTPRSADLSRAYAPVSAALGGAYFVCWSVSFWPQVLENRRRRTTVGLSPDFAALNLLGFVCYATYTLAFYFSGPVRRQYARRHDGAEPQARLSDVLFSVHALALCVVTLAQILWYDGLGPGRRQRATAFGGVAWLSLALAAAGYAIATAARASPAIDALYFLSYVKMAITFLKYLPQVYTNYARGSTVGWSIGNILLDFSGGVLSTLQLVLDCADTRDWSGIEGDVAKFALGSISIVFDLLFMVQHYVLYPQTAKHAPLLGTPPAAASLQ